MFDSKENKNENTNISFLLEEKDQGHNNQDFN